MAQNGRKEGEQLFCSTHLIFDWCREDELHPAITASNAKAERLCDLLEAADRVVANMPDWDHDKRRLREAIRAYREAQRA